MNKIREKVNRADEVEDYDDGQIIKNRKRGGAL